MAYIVNEINIYTNIVVGTAEFASAAEAMEYAQIMNELMRDTPICYKFQN